MEDKKVWSPSTLLFARVMQFLTPPHSLRGRGLFSLLRDSNSIPPPPRFYYVFALITSKSQTLKLLPFVNKQIPVSYNLKTNTTFLNLAMPSSYCGKLPSSYWYTCWGNRFLLSQSLHSHCSFTPQFSSVQSLSHVRLFATPWIVVRQASLSITIGCGNSKNWPQRNGNKLTRNWRLTVLVSIKTRYQTTTRQASRWLSELAVLFCSQPPRPHTSLKSPFQRSWSLTGRGELASGPESTLSPGRQRPE